MQILGILMHHKERHIKQILEGEFTIDGKPFIKNIKHLEVAKSYATLRKKVDKVNINTLDADLIAISHLSNYLENKPFKNVSRDDMMNFSDHLKDKLNLSESTTNLYLMKLKRFYKFVSKPDLYANGKSDQKDIKYPDSVRWITYEDSEGDLPLDNIPTKKEIKELFNACKDVRDQVILCAFLDGGLRKSELISLRVRNVKFDSDLKKYYFILPKKTKNLKTGQRFIQLFLIGSSTSYIKDYLNHHPYKNDPDAPFVYSDDNRAKSKPIHDKFLTDIGMGEIIERIVKASKIKYHITPHTLRHVSATWCCIKGFNEPMLRERYGWSKRSRMPSRYVHLANTNMKDKIMEILGIKKDDNENIDELQSQVCWNCKEENPFSYNYCFKCGVELTKKEENIATATDTGIITQEGLQDPEFRKVYNELLVQTWMKYKEMKEK